MSYEQYREFMRLLPVMESPNNLTRAEPGSLDYPEHLRTLRMTRPSRPSLERDVAPSNSDTPGLDNLPAPALPTFRCRWIRCQSELHNLATLRGHVLKRHAQMAHSPAKQGYVCWWKRCRHLAIQEDDSIEPEHNFANEQEWKQHIEEDHIQRLARKYGDGPTTNTGNADHYNMSKVKRRFLSDIEGHETTPALPQSFPENCEYPPHDVLELTRYYPEGQRSTAGKVDENARKAFLKAHGAKPSDQRRLAEETLRAMTARKQKIGPGIDRGGCTLINEARRNTFVQAPGISRIIDADS